MRFLPYVLTAFFIFAQFTKLNGKRQFYIVSYYIIGLKVSRLMVPFQMLFIVPPLAPTPPNM